MRNTKELVLTKRDRQRQVRKWCRVLGLSVAEAHRQWAEDACFLGRTFAGSQLDMLFTIEDIIARKS